MFGQNGMVGRRLFRFRNAILANGIRTLGSRRGSFDLPQARRREDQT
jgi:hypothetical protein